MARVAFIGGTNLVGPASIQHLLERGDEVLVAHTGEHEHPGVEHCEHVHGDRERLLASDVPTWRPDLLIDTMAGGASVEKAQQLMECAEHASVDRVVVVSSMDVYQHIVEAGMGDGTGYVPLARGSWPLREGASPLRTEPYPGSEAHDNAAMELELQSYDATTVVLRPGAIYGDFLGTRESYFVSLVAKGERKLHLVDGGQQVFHRASVRRVANAVVNATTVECSGHQAVNVVDPYDWTFAGLAGIVGDLLGHDWDVAHTAYSEDAHPWAVRHPIIGSDYLLRSFLGVKADEPDPWEATSQMVRWLWEHRRALLAQEAEAP